MANSAPTAVPERLRARVLAEWAPVVPLRSPWRRTWALAPLAALMAVVAARYWGPRRELDGLGLHLTWLLSAAQWGTGLWVLSLAFREAVPGRSLTRRAVAIASLLTLVVLAVNLGAKDLLAGTVVPAGREWRFWTACVEGPVLLALPVLVLATLLVGRAFPVRPGVAGALTGLAAGILTDAGWRLGCFVTAPSHVVGAHWLAVAALTAVGAALAILADTIRWRYRSLPAGK
jgi:hypothetical protein